MTLEVKEGNLTNSNEQQLNGIPNYFMRVITQND
jgi:hypothetical protein